MNKDYINTVLGRLKQESFDISENISYKGKTLAYAAKQSRFRIEYTQYVHMFFIFSEFHSINLAELNSFATLCMRYARRSKSVPWVFLPGEMIICFPVAFVDEPNTGTVELIRNIRPKWHLSDYELPVVVDCKTKKFWYPEKDGLTGIAFYGSFRAMVNFILTDG